MVFNGFLHDFYLFRREPPLESCILSQNLSSGDVMYGSWPAHAYVVISSNGIDHVYISSCVCHQIERSAYDTGDVLQVVSLVERDILWQYLSFNKLNEIK